MNELMFQPIAELLDYQVRKTNLSRAFFFEDLETMKGYTLEEILQTEEQIEAIDRIEENKVDDELYES